MAKNCCLIPKKIRKGTKASVKAEKSVIKCLGAHNSFTCCFPFAPHIFFFSCHLFFIFFFRVLVVVLYGFLRFIEFEMKAF